jgi:hypothetical protein
MGGVRAAFEIRVHSRQAPPSESVLIRFHPWVVFPPCPRPGLISSLCQFRRGRIKVFHTPGDFRHGV